MCANAYSITLSDANLGFLRSDVRVPRYERRELHEHTIHIGVGGFHRAHQAVYLDDLLATKSTERWGECGIGVLAADARMRDVLVGQDCLYTLLERSASMQSARVIGSIVNYIHAPAALEAAIEKMAAPDTRIVSLTITEGGYFLHEGTHSFLFDHSDIQYDLQHPHEPHSSLGLIAEALHRRRIRGQRPFTIMSCDNIQENGRVTKKVMLAFAGLRDRTLEKWIEDNVAFPNSMVDRITPATTVADMEYLSARFGVDDAWPVVTEPFRQWVIEDSFCNGRPTWETVGAQFSTEVAAYEIMKMRLLNGSHLAMAYLGALHGATYAHEIMADPLFLSFIAAFMDEVTPVVSKIAGVSIAEYKTALVERFSNPTINDQLTRLCSEGSAKIPKWLLPSIMELLGQERPVRLLGLVVAGWIAYLRAGVDQGGQPLTIIDARATELITLAKTIHRDPRPILALQSLFGDDLFRSSPFIHAVEEALQMISSKGVSEAIRNSIS